MLQRFFAGEEGGGLFEVVDAGDRQDEVLSAGECQHEYAVFGEAHGGDGAVRPVAAAGGEAVFFQPPFGVAEARAEDEQEQQGKGGEVGGGTVVADFVVEPGGDDDRRLKSSDGALGYRDDGLFERRLDYGIKKPK